MIAVRETTEADVRALDFHGQPQDPTLDREEQCRQIWAKKQTDDVWTFTHGDQILAIGGCGFPWGNRMVVWILLDKSVSPYLLPLTRFLRGFIDGYHCPRVEMHVCAGFDNGMKWARLLGFTNETPVPLKRFFPDGSDAYMYARTV